MSVITRNQLRELSRTDSEKLVDYEVRKITEAVISAAKESYSGIYINLPPKLYHYNKELTDSLKTVFPDSAIRILLPENILSILW
jgi:hypothetical protein